jgi:hypothetical protein
MRTKKKSAQCPASNPVRKPPMRNPKLPDAMRQKTTPTVLSDEQMHREYLKFPEDRRIAWSNHTLYTYELAESRRAYRQAHVLNHWDETDRRILFRLILGQIPKQMEDDLGMTRQAIEARINDKMLKKTGLEDRTQLILWFLGFIALQSRGKTFPGTTLIESCESDRSLLQSLRSSRQQ